MKDQYAVTIAIPTYKRPKYLRQAIDSAMNQKNPGIAYNIIVVNNDPETDMTEVRKAYENARVDIQFYTNERNLGMLGNVNRCVELVGGKWIAFLHDDDLLLPNYLCQISKYLNEEDTACLIPRRYLLFEGNGRRSLENKRKIKHAMLNLFAGRHLHNKDTYPVHVEDNVYAWQNCYGAPSCGTVYCIERIKACGLFFPEGTYSWDFYSFLKLNHQFGVKIVDNVLSVYRMSVGLSLRPEVQLDFFKSFETLKESVTDLNTECADFVRKYSEEISYLNTCILEDNARALAKESGFTLVENRPSGINLLCFLFVRLRYFAQHHLDVERPLTKTGAATLKEMGVMKSEQN